MGASLDYLVGNTDMLLEAEVIKRIQEIQNLPAKDRDHLYYVVDNILQFLSIVLILIAECILALIRTIREPKRIIVLRLNNWAFDVLYLEVIKVHLHRTRLELG